VKRRRSAFTSNVHAFLALCAMTVLLAWFIDGLLTRNGFALTLAGIALLAAAVAVFGRLRGRGGDE
jgi:hypothetical protein